MLLARVGSGAAGRREVGGGSHARYFGVGVLREGFGKLIGRYALTFPTSGVTRVNSVFSQLPVPHVRWISATDAGMSVRSSSIARKVRRRSTRR
ncbi:hypothetical protein GCM10010234_63060 [Streptomyces hawaiiensis]